MFTMVSFLVFSGVLSILLDDNRITGTQERRQETYSTVQVFHRTADCVAVFIQYFYIMEEFSPREILGLEMATLGLVV